MIVIKKMIIIKVFGKGNRNYSLILFVKNKSYLAEVQFYMLQVMPYSFMINETLFNGCENLTN